MKISKLELSLVLVLLTKQRASGGEQSRNGLNQGYYRPKDVSDNDLMIQGLDGKATHLKWWKIVGK